VVTDAGATAEQREQLLALLGGIAKDAEVTAPAGEAVVFTCRPAAA
jgi:hypothetical protein